MMRMMRKMMLMVMMICGGLMHFSVMEDTEVTQVTTKLITHILPIMVNVRRLHLILAYRNVPEKTFNSGFGLSLRADSLILVAASYVPTYLPPYPPPSLPFLPLMMVKR